MRPDRKLTTEDVDKLQRQIENRDVIAEKHNLPVYHGSKEAIEERMFPWLKRRRRRR